MRKLFVVAPVVALAGSAAADPGTLTLDRQDAQSRIGGEISYVHIDDDGLFEDVTILRFDLHGQYVMPSGFGFYGALPIAYGSGDGESETGIGELEVGAIFIPRLSSPEFSLPVHVGLTLPTAGGEDVFLNALGTQARITDYVLIVPEGLVLRAAAHPTFRSGQFFLKADAGIDLTLSQEGDGTLDPLVRLNVGAGVDLGNVSISGELVNLIITDGDQEDQVANTVAVGVRGVAGSLRPYGGVVVPIDAEDIPFALTAGLEGVIQ
jgi:hypothetical protein